MVGQAAYRRSARWSCICHIRALRRALEFGPVSRLWTDAFRAADGVLVVQQVNQYMNDVPSEVWVFDFHGMTMTPATLAQDVIDDVVAQSGGRDGYAIDERVRRVEWGATATAWELIITALVSIVGTGAYELVKARVATVMTERRQLPPSTRDDALVSARQAIALRFEDVRADQVELISEESSYGGLRRTFGLQTTDSYFEYEADRRDGIIVTRIRRSRRSA